MNSSGPAPAKLQLQGSWQLIQGLCNRTDLPAWPVRSRPGSESSARDFNGF